MANISENNQQPHSDKMDIVCDINKIKYENIDFNICSTELKSKHIDGRSSSFNEKKMGSYKVRTKLKTEQPDTNAEDPSRRCSGNEDNNDATEFLELIQQYAPSSKIKTQEKILTSNTNEHNIEISNPNSEKRKNTCDTEKESIIDFSNLVECKYEEIETEKNRQSNNKFSYQNIINTNDASYECDVCNLECASFPELYAHKCSHLGYRPYVCNECYKRFITPSKLKQHKRTHSGEKPFVCGVCSKAFATPFQFNRHKLVHTGEKPHVCEVCQKAFAISCDLKRHQRIHTGEKPYSCRICNMKFNTSTILSRHKVIHTDVLPYGCELCSKKFRSLLGYKQHVVSCRDKLKKTS